MRRYIKQEVLNRALYELIETKNPEMIRVYREVMLFHFSAKADDHRYVKDILMMPTRLFLSCLNVALIVVAFVFLPDFLEDLPDVWLAAAMCSGMFGLLWFECCKVKKNYNSLSKAFPYILIDELLNRKIIVLSPRTQKQGSHNNMKAAK